MEVTTFTRDHVIFDRDGGLRDFCCFVRKKTVGLFRLTWLSVISFQAQLWVCRTWIQMRWRCLTILGFHWALCITWSPWICIRSQWFVGISCQSSIVIFGNIKIALILMICPLLYYICFNVKKIILFVSVLFKIDAVEFILSPIC